MKPFGFVYPILFMFFSILSISSNAQNSPGFFVKGRFLFSPCDEKIILRGVNEMSCWSENDPYGENYFKEIEKTGANSVRITLDNFTPVGQIDSLINNCISNRMIPIIENHSATGNWNMLDSVLKWWLKDDLISLIKKHEKYLLVNIANEAGDWEITDSQFISFYSKALKKFRDHCIKTPIIIDATGWGQNIDILQSTWKSISDSDPLHNVLFSAHIWWADNDSTKIVNEIRESVEIGMPLLIGEFAHKAVGCNCCIDYRTIIMEATKNDIGYLAWSWGAVPNNDCSEMDMTCDGTFQTLGHGKECERGETNWGLEVALTSEFSIKNTSVRPKWILNDFSCE